MGEKELKHVIALLLEDAKRVQKLEPNAGTEARIGIAESALTQHVTTIAIEIDAVSQNQIESNVNSILQNSLKENEKRISDFRNHKISPLLCEGGDGVDRVYHDTMVKVLKIEIEKLRSQIAVNEIVAN